MYELYTVKEALKKKYGWRDDQAYKPDKCVALVSDSIVGHTHQCGKGNGHGAHGLYCKAHAVYKLGSVQESIKLFKADLGNNTVTEVQCHKITDKRYYYWRTVRDDFVIEDYQPLKSSSMGGLFSYKMFRVERDAIKFLLEIINRGIERLERDLEADKKIKESLIKRL